MIVMETRLLEFLSMELAVAFPVSFPVSLSVKAVAVTTEPLWRRENPKPAIVDTFALQIYPVNFKLEMATAQVPRGTGPFVHTEFLKAE